MSLHNKRVVLAASRKTDEMSLLVEKQKGTPLVRSLQGTVFLNDDQAREDLKRIVEEEFDWMIFTTGIGTNTLLDLAEEMNMKDSVLAKIHGAKVGSRGYKTFAALKKLEIQPLAKDEDGTINGLVESLRPFSFKGARVMVQLHGENAPSLIQFLEEAGARVMQVLPYKHVDPDFETIQLFCKELLNAEVDAVCFTAAIQVRSLFKYVKKQGILDEIREAFKKSTLAVAVGKVTAEALHDEGIERVLSPELERMGAMVIELSRYYEEKEE